jgi:hypothetical protein
MNREALTQPLMMRRDYGKTEDKKEKEALMLKEVPLEDYDHIQLPKKEVKCIVEIKDYDSFQDACVPYLR